jgi:hypothetical protein
MPCKKGKIGQKTANIGENSRKTQDNCGNRGFSIDFARPKVAL